MELVLTIAIFLAFIGTGLLLLRAFPEWDPRDFPEYARDGGHGR